METLVAFVGLASLAGIAIGLVLTVINIIRRKPCKGFLKSAGISFCVMIIAALVLPDSSTEQRDRSDTLTAVVTNDRSDRMSDEGGSEPGVRSNMENKNDAEYIGIMSLNNSTDFSEGRALTEIYEMERDPQMMEDAVDAFLGSDEERMEYALKYLDGHTRVALIDTNGMIVWESELTRAENALTKASVFRDGLAYFTFNGNEKNSYNIIDSDGNITFTKDYTNEFKILGHGNGLFLVAEHVANLDVDEWRIGAIDKNGNEAVPFKVYELSDNTLLTEPEPVEEPQDISAEIEYIRNSIEQIQAERQAWIEECWNYQGEINAEYQEMVGQIEEEYVRRFDELREYRVQLEEEYSKQLEKYKDYQQAVMEYEIATNATPKVLHFDESSHYHGNYPCEYLGENIYKIDFDEYYVLLNIETQSIIYTRKTYDWGESYIYSFLSDFENGKATVLYHELDESGQFFQSIYFLGTDGMLTPVISNMITEPWGSYIRYSEGLLFVESDENDDVSNSYMEDSVFYPGFYYNLEGKVAIDFPQYSGKHEYSVGPFCKGHAILQIKGADGLSYFTAIDKNGDLMFEPQSGFENVSISSDGQYIVAYKWENITVFDLSGRPLASVNGSVNKTDVDTMHDGVIRFEDFFVNVRDKRYFGGNIFIETVDFFE